MSPFFCCKIEQAAQGPKKTFINLAERIQNKKVEANIRTDFDRSLLR
jgi:hypothetical protein